MTEWENLGYHDSDMMGRPGNLDPRNFWQADLDEAAGRLVWLIRRYQPDVITTYNAFGGYGHPDHIRTHDVAVRGVPAGRRSGLVSGAARPEHGGTGPRSRRAAWRRGRRPSSTSRPSRRRCATALQERMEEPASETWWSPPKDATPEQIAEFEAFLAKMLVPDEAITTWIDIARGARRASGRRSTSTSRRSRPTARSSQFGLDAWREFWAARPTSCASPASDDDARDGPVRRARLARSAAQMRGPLPGQQVEPLRRAEDLAQHDLAVAGRIEEVRLRLVEDEVRPHAGLDEVGPGT